MATAHLPTDFSIKLQNYALTLAAKHWHPTAKGLPTLALHGWLDNAASFDLLAPKLPSTQIVALDWAGHGLSDHFAPGYNYDLYQNACHALAVADSLGWTKFNILAHSLGACVAVLIAGMFPERVRSLVLIEGLGPQTAPSEQLPEKFAKHYAAFEPQGQKRAPTYSSHEVAAQARFLQSNVSKEAADILAKRGLREEGLEVTWRTDPRLFLPSPHPLTEEQLHAFLRRINCPSLLILAENGWAFTPEQFKQRQSCLPGLKTLTLAGSHHLHMETPELLARAMQENGFL